jgi:hypothetical protein
MPNLCTQIVHLVAMYRLAALLSLVLCLAGTPTGAQDVPDAWRGVWIAETPAFQMRLALRDSLTMTVRSQKPKVPRETVRCVYSVEDGRLKVPVCVSLKAVLSGLDSSKAATRIGYADGRMRYDDSTLTYEERVSVDDPKAQTLGVNYRKVVSRLRLKDGRLVVPGTPQARAFRKQDDR